MTYRIQIVAMVGSALAVTLMLANAKETSPPSKWEIGGWAGAEIRLFPRDALYAGQAQNTVQPSIVFAPKVTWADSKGNWAFDFAPYYRWDAIDRERSHGDVREAAFNWFGDGYDVRVGVGKVYWGVTEARQLVDIVNQTDLVESFTEDEKLGQPMLYLRTSFDNFGLDLLLLPGFRERTFPGVDGRLRPILPIDEDNAQYESSAGPNRVDFAARAHARFDEWDIGISFFHGTSREPRFVPSGGVFLPYYDVIDQMGLDVQATIGATLWKLESITRDGHGGAARHRFGAVVAGIEHTFYQIGETTWDLGLVVEGLWDGRSAAAPPTIYDNDIFLGARVQFNDVGDSSALIGVLTDVETGSALMTLEGSARIADTWRLEFEGALAIYIDESDSYLRQFRNDSHVMIRLPHYF
jgi:hypothetical protein